MGDCCSSTAGQNGMDRKARCPACQHPCAEVPLQTILHHISAPWAWTPMANRYFFCDDPACEVVYFGDDRSIITKAQMRTPVGVKTEGDGLLCYCFGITRSEYRRNPATRDFVLAQTAAGQCACRTRNPSGRCCLKDFPGPSD